MQNPVHDNQSAARYTSGKWLAVWGLPAVAVLLMCCLLPLVQQERASVRLDLLGTLYGFFLMYVWSLYRMLSVQTEGSYQVKSASAIALNVLTGPLAALLASQLCLILTRAAVQIANLVGDVMPNALPIANSAVTLLELYGSFVAVTIALGAGISAQSKLTCSLSEFLNKRGCAVGKLATLCLGAVLGVALALPGCLWVLLVSSVFSDGNADTSWYARMIVASFACFSLAFGILAWFNHKLIEVIRSQLKGAL